MDIAGIRKRLSSTRGVLARDNSQEKQNELAAYKIEGPAPNTTLAEYLNRTNVVPLVKKCFMERKSRVIMRVAYFW